ncbi:hypothetical protein [Salibacterium aidingense]|uniref:hypothetical protein n=1 Tax=Salibacterium aidingense TaxID=384933 RepID=UPI00041C49F1|nr:hypothetical protein [Salibacterium aidingense]
MERIQEEQKIQSLRKIEKAIGNAEKALQSPNGQPLSSKPEDAIIQAKRQLNMAWNYRLTQRL